MDAFEFDLFREDNDSTRDLERLVGNVSLNANTHLFDYTPDADAEQQRFIDSQATTFASLLQRDLEKPSPSSTAF